MNRRRLLATLGMAAAGTSAAVGTGAFTSVSADRSVSVHVGEDADALLAMEPSLGPNGEYAVVENGQIAIRLDASNESLAGGGANDNAVTRIEDILQIRNQGTQEVFVFFGEFGGEAVTLFGGTTTAKNNGNRIYDAPPSGLVPNETPEMEGSANVLRTPVGAPIPVGLEIDTTGSHTPGDLSEQFMVHAQAAPPEDSPFDDSRFDPDSDG
jgi:hypothetical protein